MYDDIIKDIISEQFGIDRDNIDDNADIVDDFGADSLDVVEMVMELEENLEITIPDEDVATLRTVRDVIDYVERNT